jgi:uncharacterized Zn finger protein
MIIKGEERIGMVNLQCPNCGTSGIENVVSGNSVRKSKDGDIRFHIVYCMLCGYIYGVFGKIETTM